MSYAIRFDQELQPTILCENLDQVLEVIERVQRRAAPALSALDIVRQPRELPAKQPGRKPGPKPGRKPRAKKDEPAAPPPKTERASKPAAPEPQQRAVVDPELPPVTFNRESGRVSGAGKAILTAFSKDQNYPLEQLAAHIYGKSDKSAMRQLNYVLNQMVYDGGRLKKLGARTYKAVVAP